MIELHSAQLQLQKYKSSVSSHGPDINNNTDETDQIKKRLDEELARRFSKDNPTMSLSLAQHELELVKRENEQLKEQLLQANSEIYGAKLASKYLDKELAGRIQQIQLFSKALKPEEHERLALFIFYFICIDVFWACFNYMDIKKTMESVRSWDIPAST